MGLHLSKLNPLCQVSCKIYKYCERSELGSVLRQFLLGKDNLATLHLDCASPEVTIPDGWLHSHECMLALKELVLRSYNWNHSAATSVDHRSFHTLERLPDA